MQAIYNMFILLMLTSSFKESIPYDNSINVERNSNYLPIFNVANIETIEEF